jgi:hypothetical protein
MFRPSRLLRTLAVGLAAAAATLSTTQIASAAPDPNPSEIRVPTGYNAFLVGHATGTQNYTCDSATLKWTVAPVADLFDDNGKLIVKHSAGPTWTSTADGSAVTGAVANNNTARVTVDPTAIPWLLLDATPKKDARVGLLTKTRYIQRVNTTGGLGPSGPCDPTKDTPKSVPYTANYRFWKPVGA